MRTIAEQEKRESRELLEQVLAIPTVNGVSREIDLARFLEACFKDYGIPAWVQVLDEKRGNLIAEVEGTNKETMVIWNGHLDTVPYGNREEWESAPEIPVLRDGRMYARGASDMKSGLAAMVSVLCQMKRAGKEPLYTLRFIGTCDEEKNGDGANRILAEGLLGTPGAIIIGEPTDNALGIVQKGCLWLKVSFSGRTSHSAYPAKGTNAVQHGLEICQGLRAFVHFFSHPLLGGATAEITGIKGGIAPNMIPDACEITMDIRLTPDITVEAVLNKLKVLYTDSMKKTGGALQMTCEVLNRRRALETAPGNPWVQRMKASVEAGGGTPLYVGANYFTDASVFVQENRAIPVLLFGPGDPKMAHQPNEYVEMSRYEEAVEALKVFGYGKEVL